MALAGGLIVRQVFADRMEVQTDRVSLLHPTFAMLDEAGANVLKSGGAVSTMRTCGQCHDTDYIAGHSFHSDLGLSDVAAGQGGRQPWDSSRGLFGQWDPLTYRYLSQPGDERLDLGTADWIMVNAQYLVGGGPATTSRAGEPLASLPVRSDSPETTILNPSTGRSFLWSWSDSGTMEMNCFLCHLSQPNNAARMTAIRGGAFDWANTATLEGTGLVTGSAAGWTWNPAAFDQDGELLPEFITLQDPSNANCAQCHGLVHTGEAPLTLPSYNDLAYPQTATTGQVFSAQRISDSGVNLAGKDLLARSWDIHAERGLDCVDCHFSLNNPVLEQMDAASQPDHLLFDPRRLDFAEYLQSPDHDFARGQSAQYGLDPTLRGTMRRCESCHDAQVTHADWLPYTGQHMANVACETCHIPQMVAPAVQLYDWTIITPDGEPITSARGVEGDGSQPTDLVTGYQPVWMPRTDIDGRTMLAPYNLITAWYWVYDDANGNTRPVRLLDLETAYFDEGRYASAIVTAFDSDGDGELSPSELVLDSQAKTDLVTARLEELGLSGVRVLGSVQPYSINHGVARGEYAIRDCRACHTDDSRVGAPIQLAPRLVDGVYPEFVSGTNVDAGGRIFSGDDGALYYQPNVSAEGLYVFGHSRVAWVDWVGGLFFLGVLGAVAVHGGLRALAARRERRSRPRVRKVYMYQSYERFWHWLQTVLILVLLLTGLFIHRPDLFGFSFPGLVVVHNVSAAILAINAALSLFYHLTTGQIRQFLPRPYGFFDDAIVQTKYYLRGIFKREAHPFEKTPEKKMNPLQQVTYLGILNVLLPLQGLTGILMWGVQQWPQVAEKLGGLAVLAPFHTLIAWIFAAFIVGHVYLTTTGGPGALDSIKAMVTGWEDVEVHESATPGRKRGKKG